MYNMLATIAEGSSKIVYDGELSFAAWATLIFMIVSIGGGLTWSLYRAVTAEKRSDQRQYPEEV